MSSGAGLCKAGLLLSLLPALPGGTVQGGEVPAALRVQGPLSPRNASYRISARLDERTHRVTAHEVLSWRNLENRPADRLVLHLYQNAFKNFGSTFIREVGPQLRRDRMPAQGFGAIDVTALRIGKEDLLPVSVVDDTLLTVPLLHPVGPSAAIEVEIEWTVTLPKVFARSGHAGDFHAVAQWFPKIGVYDCGDTQTDSQIGSPGGPCRWRAHQYHGSTEFFADYGVYDVELDVPATTVVGATGVLVEERHSAERRVLHYHAEDVHDFVWMTDPRFIEVTDVVRDQWGSVAIRLLTRAGQEGMSARHLRATREGLLELERRYGPYPYSNVTVIIPPADAMGASGMEYPTLFTSIPAALPESITLPEEVTLHELGHQFFYGIIGTDEVEEAWLDEGLNETFTTWAVEHLYGTRCNSVNLWGVCLSAVDAEWVGYRFALRRAPIATPGYLFPPGTYARVTYAQTAVTLRTLEGYLGPARMEAGMRRYTERFRFQHPRRRDFVAAFNEGAGEDLTWFWDQALTTTRTADYQVMRAGSVPHRLLAGLWDCPPRPLPPPPDPMTPDDKEARLRHRESQEAACLGKPPGRHEFDPDRGRNKGSAQWHDGEVHVQRLGDFVFPVDILVRFTDGTEVRERWGLAEQQAAGEMRVRRYRYPRRNAPIERVEIDPAGKVLLDTHRLNNGLLVHPDPVPAQRLSARWQGLVQTLLDLLGP